MSVRFAVKAVGDRSMTHMATAAATRMTGHHLRDHSSGESNFHRTRGRTQTQEATIVFLHEMCQGFCHVSWARTMRVQSIPRRGDISGMQKVDRVSGKGGYHNNYCLFHCMLNSATTLHNVVVVAVWFGVFYAGPLLALFDDLSKRGRFGRALSREWTRM